MRAFFDLKRSNFRKIFIRGNIFQFAIYDSAICLRRLAGSNRHQIIQNHGNQQQIAVIFYFFQKHIVTVKSPTSFSENSESIIAMMESAIDDRLVFKIQPSSTN